jgi:hypothetical protein
VSDKLTCRFWQGFVCRNLSQFGCPRKKPPVSVAGRGEAFTALVGCDGLTGRIVTADLAPPPPPRHHPDMGQDPNHQRDSNVESTFPPAANPASSADARRHVLPKDLPNAVKHLNDEELGRLLAVTVAEAKRRGRQSSPTDQPSPNRNADAPGSLTRGQLNAVRAAFKAGITPARIARQFGLSQSAVRMALKSHKGE